MAAVGVEEDPVVQAARILLNLRHRRLQWWPEWVPKEPEPEPAAVEADSCLPPPPPERWPKRQRNGNRVRSSLWAASWALPKQQEREPHVASASAGYGAGEEREPSPAPPPRWSGERSSVGPVRDDRRSSGSPAFYSAPAGSGPSTSADRKARSRRAVETTTTFPGSVGAPPKQPHMKESSPETPLDFGAAGSGASSSGDDGAKAKRRALGSASSGDEGCSSSPDKRARVVDAGDDDHGEKHPAVSEPKTQTPDADKVKDKGGVVVKFEFDLNMPCPEDDECAAAGFW